MQLSHEQREQFEREGYLFFPGLFALLFALEYGLGDTQQIAVGDHDALRPPGGA